MNNETCNTCGQQIPEGYTPVQDSSALSWAIRSWAEASTDSPRDLGEMGEWVAKYAATHPEDYPGWTPDGWEVPGVLGLVVQHETWGGMDKGTDCGVVFRIKAPAGDRFVLIKGEHQSHVGTSWYPEGAAEVFPNKVEKTVWATR